MRRKHENICPEQKWKRIVLSTHEDDCLRTRHRAHLRHILGAVWTIANDVQMRSLDSPVHLLERGKKIGETLSRMKSTDKNHRGRLKRGGTTILLFEPSRTDCSIKDNADPRLGDTAFSH